MAISVTPTVKGTMALDEFVSFCKANVRYDDEDSIMSAAEPLAALANDDMLLVNAINSELYRSIENRGNARVLSTQSLLLHIDPIFKVRANIWKKPVERRALLTMTMRSTHTSMRTTTIFNFLLSATLGLAIGQISTNAIPTRSWDISASGSSCGIWSEPPCHVERFFSIAL